MKTQIIESKNYAIFELHEFNRDVKKTKYLEESMKTHGWISAYPMHVIRNGKNKLKIKAGHHRFVTAKKLNIPVKYVVCDDDISIHELEKSTTNWSKYDYLISHIRSGKDEYVPILSYYEQTGISLNACIAMLAGEGAGSHNKVKEFKDGSYKLGDVTHANIVKNIVLHCKKHGVKWAHHYLFVNALSRMIYVEEFNPSFFMKKAKAFKKNFEKQKDVKGYLELIERIYNLRNRNKIPLVFLSEIAINNRNPIKRK